MKKFISFIFVIFLFASSSSYALDFIKFGTSHDADFWGTADVYFDPFPSALQYLAPRGKNQLTSVELTDQNVLDAFNGDFGAFEAIVVSEEIGDPLSNESYAMINQFVSEGGCLIVTGDHADNEDVFLNSVFGYNVGVITVDDEPPLPTFPIQPDSTGTQFRGGPAQLVSADLTSAYSNTPGKTIYSGAEGVALFTDQFGEGTVVAIGWDYCCTGEPEDGVFVNTEQQILDWYEVVNRSFDQCVNPVLVSSVPTLSEWGLIAMAGVLGIVGFMVMRRRKVAA
ncbi:MAG: hypothetical protein DHS20C13_26680 [Thermodesulfobacteriota bacterium]|nr:MAG: hypothetical protein DHS20C13_26680 [Thermodesulfobacteriota bacterium]